MKRTDTIAAEIRRQRPELRAIECYRIALDIIEAES
jgi:hypothetical protein